MRLKREDIENQIIAVELVHKYDNREEYNTNFLMPSQEGGKILPECAQVCAFIGTVFDTNTRGHLQKLKKMDPIDVEMAANEKPLHQLDQVAFEDHIDAKPMSELVTKCRSIRYFTDSPAKSPNGNIHTDSNINDDRTNNHVQDPLDILDRVRMKNSVANPMLIIISVLNDSKEKDLRFKKAI
nr:phosphate transporter PHO1 homolog 10 isoform X1 [Tanacetum cinerariifolium]